MSGSAYLFQQIDPRPLLLAQQPENPDEMLLVWPWWGQIEFEGLAEREEPIQPVGLHIRSRKLGEKGEGRKRLTSVRELK
jgi:hypothetical protein